ncbi:MAG: Na(+)/H(+) antiporter subunit D, partial [Proteobacteria bacterium]|nr:Na(+)/H(+) antiporter subunit D [Pseudomonadota bacterium]
MTSSIMVPPAIIFILGSILIPFLKGKTKSIYMLLIPAAAFYVLMNIPHGNIWTYAFWGYDLIMGRIDKLSMVFGYIFIIMAFLGILFA